MKKVLSLFLVCVMLLSFALVANAAGEGLTVTGGAWVYYEDEDLGEYVSSFTAGETGSNTLGTSSVTTFDLEVKATTKSSGGFITIDYDETKVKPVRYNTTATKAYDSFSETNYTKFVQTGSGISTVESTASTYPDTTSGAVIYTWTGAVEANTTVAYIHFVLLDGVTTEDFDADTFKLSTDSAFLTKYTRSFSAGYDPQTGVATDVSSAVTFTYPGSGKTVGGGEEPEVDAVGATEEEVNDTQDWTAGEFKYPTDTAGSTDNAAVGKKVAAFGKANVGLTAGNYGVKIGNRFYPGKMDVPADSLFAIIVVNTDGDAAIKGSYTYSIYTGNAESNPTIIVENLPAVVK